MTEEQVRMPKLRFPGFADAWEQRKLGDVAEFSKGHGYSKDDLRGEGDPIILYGRLYTDYEAVVSSVDTYATKKANSILSQGGDIIIPASGETAEDIARASVVETPGIILGGDLNVVRLRTSFAPEFVAREISNGACQKELSKKAQGKSVVHIHSSDLQEVILKYPALSEQRRIGAFFASLDDLITLHQRKLSHLDLLKKGLLQKMFPKQGEAYPEIRFPGFTDAWEQRKLGDLLEIRRGLTYTPVDVQENGVRVLRSSNIQNDKFVMHPNDVFVSEKSVNIAYAANNEILITSANGSSKLVGKHALIKGIPEGTAVAGGFMLVGHAQNPLFVNTHMNSNWYQRFIDTYVAGGNGAIGNLRANDLRNQPVLTPSEPEQHRIGAFFASLDDLITLHQRKLTHLQQQKKALLQQMFV